MTEQERQTILYGDPSLAAPERVPLRAGPLTLDYTHGDLRTIRWGRHEIIRRLYAAVRDEHWGTADLTYQETERDIRPDSFRIVYEGRHENAARGVDFRAMVTLTGTADGTVTFDFDGEALTTFRRNRIGICVLHPAEVAGKHVIAAHTDGSETPGHFPETISPHQPFFNLASLAYEVAPGVRATIAFTGDVFEMEDQRNWLDASFKTYSTPLALPMPVEVPAGTRVHQRVTVSVRGAEASDLTTPRAATAAPVRVSVSLDARAERPFRRPGLMLPPDGSLPSGVSSDAVRALRPDHLRVDIDAAQPGWREVLLRAGSSANALDTDLLVGVRSPEALTAADLPALTRNPALWLLLQPSPGAIATARAALPAGARVLYGSAHNFTELNRNRPRPGDVDGVFFAGNPQVHAFDSLSIMETPLTLADVLKTARSLGDFGARAEFAVGPLTLGGPRQDGDPRHRSLFGAAWYLAAFAAAADAGATRVTLGDIAGPRSGALDAAGNRYPLGTILATLPAATNAHLAHINVSDPHTLSGLAVWANDGHGWVFLVNRTDTAQRVSVHGFGGRGQTLRVLDEATGGVFYARDTEADGTEDALLVTLRAYAVAVVATGPGA
jgi:hypothetical protein